MAGLVFGYLPGTTQTTLNHTESFGVIIEDAYFKGTARLVIDKPKVGSYSDFW